MDLTRDFIEKIEEMSVPHRVEYNDRLYTDKSLKQIPVGPVVKTPLMTESLSSVVDYLEAGVDGDVLSGRPIIHVVEPDRVDLYMEMNEDKERDNPISASIDVCRFPFGRFMDAESFIIQLQSNFLQDEATQDLLKLVSNISQDSSVIQGDNGVSQQITARNGISLFYNTKMPNPVTLRPYRTFPEVEQPASSFVFRAQGDGNGVALALFEADGKAWKHQAIANIKDYFISAMQECGLEFVILA